MRPEEDGGIKQQETKGLARSSQAYGGNRCGALGSSDRVKSLVELVVLDTLVQ